MSDTGTANRMSGTTDADRIVELSHALGKLECQIDRLKAEASLLSELLDLYRDRQSPSL